MNTRHFQTDHLLDDLKGRSTRGGAATIAAQAIKFFLQIVTTMALARLLEPEDFGLIAMVAAVAGFVSMFNDGGLSMATIQREHITQAQVSGLFWVNVVISVIVSLVVASLSPVIAWFYGESRLVGITQVMAITFIFSGLAVQHKALLRRQMRFGLLAIIDVVSMTVGAAIAVLCAWNGSGYWAIVALTMGTALTTCLLSWLITGWIPSFVIRSSGIRSMLGYGGELTGFNILNYFTRNADNIIVGYVLGSYSLGIYSRAYHLLMQVDHLKIAITPVMIPALSRLQSDPQRFRRAFLEATGMLSFVGMPVVAFLFLVADQIVDLVLGPGWEQTASVFQWLTPAAILGTVSVAPSWLCISLDRARVQLAWALLAAPITVTGFAFGAQWGIDGVAAAFSITWCPLFVLFMAMACRRSPVSFFHLLQTILPSLASAIAAAVACIAIFWTLPVDDLPIIAILFVKGISYGLISLLLITSVPVSRRRLFLIIHEGAKAFQREVPATLER